MKNFLNFLQKKIERFRYRDTAQYFEAVKAQLIWVQIT